MSKPLWSVGEVVGTYKRKKQSTGIMIKSSAAAAAYFRTIQEYSDNFEYREMFYALYLSRSGMVIGHTNISKGGVSSTVADPKIIFQHALICNASSLIISHNHPSGNEQPSESDIILTKKIKQGAELLDMALLDHVIMTQDKHYSLVDNGKI